VKIRNSGYKILFVLLLQIFTQIHVVYSVYFASDLSSISQGFWKGMTWHTWKTKAGDLKLSMMMTRCDWSMEQTQTVVFFPDRVSKLRALCTKCNVLYSEKITENKADSSAYGLSTVM